MIYLLFAFYLMGGLGLLLKRAYKSAKDPNTPWDNIPTYCKIHAPEILMNFGVSTALFIGIWRDTAFLSKMLLLVGVQRDIEVPLNPLTAVLFGIASDQIADILISVISFVTSKLKAILPFGGTQDDTPKP